MMFKNLILLREFRVLFIVFGLGAAAALWEFQHPSPPKGASDVLSQLNPELPRWLHQKGRIAIHEHGDYAAARGYFERALAGGGKHIEDLLYEYAEVLAILGEAPEVIDDAVREWHFRYPASTRRDPRKTYKERYRRELKAVEPPEERRPA